VRRIVLLLTVGALLLALTAGVAVAVTKTCGKSPCYGTDKRDLLYEQAGDNLDDTIYGKSGGDTIDANNFAADKDVLYGQRGNDTLYVNDGDTEDEARGGTGTDTCVVDAEAEAFAGCDTVIVDFAGTQSV